MPKYHTDRNRIRWKFSGSSSGSDQKGPDPTGSATLAKSQIYFVKTASLGRKHDVVLDEIVLLDDAVDVAARDVGPDAELARLELPLLRHAVARRPS